MDKRDKRNDISRDGARRPPFRARRERPQGKETPLSARAYLAGKKIEPGTRFGEGM